MRSRTHLVFSSLVTLSLFQPSNTKDLLIYLGAGVVGGTISDLDVRTSDTHKAVDYLFAVACVLVPALYFIDKYYNYGIFSLVVNSNYFLNILGFVIFASVCFYGMHKPHRSFLHSFLGMFLLSGTLFVIYDKIWLPFLIGMLSHVFLDIFNIRKVKLFYPFGKGFSLKLCSYDSKADSAIFFVSLISSIILLYLL